VGGPADGHQADHLSRVRDLRRRSYTASRSTASRLALLVCEYLSEVRCRHHGKQPRFCYAGYRHTSAVAAQATLGGVSIGWTADASAGERYVDERTVNSWSAAGG